MINLFKKRTFFASTLLGLVFFFGGASTASAADVTKWAFEYAVINPVTMQQGLTGQVLSYSTQALCEAGQASYASDTNYLIHTYEITKSCYQTTESSLATTRATALANIASADIGPSALDAFNLYCGLPNPISKIKYSLMDCIPSAIYYVLYKPASWALLGAGKIFDVMLSLSITGDMVSPPFIDSSWTIIRDFSNMLFIFVLLYTGIMTMFGAADWRKVVLQVVFIALLINFSLFFTKVIIDAGNILAVGIESSINLGGSGLSEGLVGSFAPQQFLAAAGKLADPLNATIVFLVATIVSGYAAYIFFKIAILFTRRLVVFWFLMITSPIAFISTTLPKGSKFGEWLHTLVAQAFVAPVFLFFIYIIMKVISAGNGFLGGFNQTGSWFDSLIGPVIAATLLIKALDMTLDFTESMAGSAGEGFSKLVSGAMGFAVGGASATARLAVGGTAAALNKRGIGGATTKYLSQASYNPLNVGGKDSIFGATIGGGIAKGVSGLGIGKGGGSGGYAKVEEERNKKADAKLREEAKKAEPDAKARYEARQDTEAAEKRSSAAKQTLVEARTREEVSKNKTSEAQTAHDTNLLSPNINPRLKIALDAAKKEEQEAIVAREVAEAEATLTQKTAEKVKERTTKETKEVREHYAKEAEERGMYETAEKIRKGEKVGKKSIEDMIKEEAEKKAKEEAKKESGDGEKSH